VIEAMACGTPVLATRGSALVDRDAEWYSSTQPAWNKLHQAWWHVPLVADLAASLEQAHADLRHPERAREIRRDAKLAAAAYRPENVMPMWVKLLGEI
jgi:glycosyltransferase involved in cell wall biosynthesis